MLPEAMLLSPHLTTGAVIAVPAIPVVETFAQVRPKQDSVVKL
jgi:hypothetical protein